MKFMIKSDKLEHKDQIIELDFSEIEIMTDLNLDRYSFYKYEGKLASGKYIGPSRIDGFPIFQIDTIQLDREEKISQVLK